MSLAKIQHLTPDKIINDVSSILVREEWGGGGGRVPIIGGFQYIILGDENLHPQYFLG